MGGDLAYSYGPRPWKEFWPKSPNVKMAAEQIRRQIPTEGFDYQALLHCLKDYARPRDGDPTYNCCTLLVLYW